MNHSRLRSQVVTSRSDATIDESSHMRRSTIALIDKSRALLVDSRECLVLSRQRLARSARLLRVTYRSPSTPQLYIVAGHAPACGSAWIGPRYRFP